MEERYLKYNSTTERMDVYRAREYTYDINGNMTKKKILEGDDWIEYTITYSKGAHITDWDNAVSSGSVNSNLVPTYDANGNMTYLPALTVTSGPNQFDLLRMEFTYDRKNRLSTYHINSDDIRTLKWDALGRIREKTWTVGETSYKQVFYHDGRTLMQIWDETKDGAVVSRDIAYDLYVGETGYLKDIDFNSNPDEEGYLVKDAQGSVRAIVNVAYSGGTYTVTTERYNTDGYGAWLDFDDAHSNGTHYMRYIATRVEDYCNSGSTNDNQALYHTDHRHYLPFLGIFLQREPLMVWPSKRSLGLSENPASLNPYRYAENKPTYASDSTGLQTVDQCNIIRNNCIIGCAGRDDEMECIAGCEDDHQDCLRRATENTQVFHADYLNATLGFGMQDPVTLGALENGCFNCVSDLVDTYEEINLGLPIKNSQMLDSSTSEGATVMSMADLVELCRLYMCYWRAVATYNWCKKEGYGDDICIDVALRVFEDCMGIPHESGNGLKPRPGYDYRPYPPRPWPWDR